MALAAFALDQGTKALALANDAALSSGVAVIQGFNLVLVRNSGVSFGMLGDVPWWVLALLTLAIIGWLIVLMLLTIRRSEAVAYGLLIGGALGNVTDRFRLGAVTDFLDFYVGRLHWPAFNFADVAIFCGAAILLLSSFSEVTGRNRVP